jgi:PAS domain S-box-containing protein
MAPPHVPSCHILARRRRSIAGVLVSEPTHESGPSSVDLRYRFLAEISPVQLWTALPDGNLDYVTDQTARRLGLTPEQLLADGWQNVVHPEDLPRAVERWTHALKTGATYEVEFRLKLESGEYAWHLVRAVPQRDASGSIVRWFGTNTNIDAERAQQAQIRSLLSEVEQQSTRLREEAVERRHAEVAAEEARARAEQASQIKDEFLATASHELRTPLNAILGWAQILRGGSVDASGFIRGLETIERNAKAQVRLIDDILDGSRIITGKLHLEIRALDLNAVVEAAVESVRPAAAARNIAITIQLEPAAAHVKGDPDRLQQVVWNLMNNAIKFTQKGGRIEVRACRAGTHIELSVADNGLGIAESFLPHVFERFRQADGSSTRQHGGLGLGLALVRHLVEAHGGTVRADSAGKGKGATFTLTLPVLAVFGEAQESILPPNRTQHPLDALGADFLRAIRVLVIDDEPDARELVALVLRTRGAEVLIASSVDQALDLLEQRAPHILVSDIGMPQTDGYTLVRKIRALPSAAARVPAIALTAYAREQDRRLALDAGFQAYLSKPVDPEALARLVGEVARAP